MAEVVIAGMDMGTNTTVLTWQEKRSKAAGVKPAAGEPAELHALNAITIDGIEATETMFRSVVGVPKATLLPGVLPKGKKPLIGEEALQYKMHLDLFWPVDGTVKDLEHSQILMKAIREMIDPKGAKEIRMVIGSPANATKEELQSIRRAVTGIVDKMLIVPEPFLAAMGYREESRLGQPGYHDPVINTLFVDIGAGTTDLCKVQGYYPTENDLISTTIAGNYVDKKIRKFIEKTYPDARLADVTITRIKEENSFVGKGKGQVEVKVPIHGKHKTLNLTQAIQESCEELVGPIVEAIEEMARRCDPEAVEEMLANITLTGGGSQIPGIDKMIEKTLKDKDYLSAKVTIVHDYKPLVARGAMKTGLKLKDDQWTIPM